MSKIIQIVRNTNQLLGLDEDGTVWEFVKVDADWIKVVESPRDI